MDIDMIGPGIVLGLGCIGSSIGCGIGSMALHGVLTRVETGQGKLIGLSAIASSQAIYGFVLMILMRNHLQAGTLSGIGGIGIGFFVGLALMVSSIYQGKCAATAIQASAKQPAVFMKAAVAVGIIESFSIFAFVFSLLII